MALARSDYLNALVSTYNKFEPPEDWYNKKYLSPEENYMLKHGGQKPPPGTYLAQIMYPNPFYRPSSSTKATITPPTTAPATLTTQAAAAGSAPQTTQATTTVATPPQPRVRAETYYGVNVPPLAPAVQQIYGMLEPYTRAQEESAARAFGQALQNLQNRWAARGLLASGEATAQEREAAESLARQIAEIRANQLAQTVPWAMQALREEGELTGVYGGVPTLEARRLAIEKALQEAGLTGVYEGKETIPAMQAREEIAQRWAQIRGITPTGEPTIDRIRIETDYQLAKAQQDWNRIYQGGLLDLEKLRILSDNAYREGQLKLGTLDTTLRYLETLGYPKDMQQGVTQIVNYAQSGGAGMFLRNYVASKNGTVDYDDSTGKVTINLPRTPPISFVAGNNAQMAALGLGYNPATGQHYVSDPAKFNAFTGNFYGLGSTASSSKSSGGGSSSFSLPSSGRGSESWARQQVSNITGKTGSIESQLSGMSQSEKLATLKKAGLIT